jgi:hypothetical protein
VRPGRVAAALVLLAVPALGDDEARRVTVETVTARTSCFVGESVPVRLRVGYDADFFDRFAVPLHRRPMDVPLHVVAPWLERVPGARVDAEPAPADPGGSVTFAVNDGVVAASRTRGSGPLSVVEIVRRIVPSAPGEIVLAAPSVRFAHATRFEEDLIHGRSPLDRSETTVSGASTTLRVSALPEQGRPADFTGAVGRFTATASTDARQVTVGEVFRLVLRIEGEGDVAAFQPPGADRVPGFHVLGVLDRREAEARTFTCDLSATRADVTEVPPIAVTYFDPAPPGAYRTASTASIPLDVRPSPLAVPDAPAESRVEPARSRAPVVVVVAVVALVILAGVVALVLRRRGAAARALDPSRARMLAASGTVRARLAAADADLAGALSDYLAARLDCAPAAVISPDLPARLQRSGLPPDVADRAARLLESLVAARYGGQATGSGAHEILAIVDDIERRLAR